jgi:hypothetical protein
MRDARISYVRNPTNLGIAGNWNRCLELAETALFTLHHADDRLNARYAEIIRELADHEPRAVDFHLPNTHYQCIMPGSILLR